jgi:large subunit ribosomal protein L23
MVYAGKKKTSGSKRGFIQGKTTAFKKAIITLKQDQVIDFYSNV